MTSASSLRSLGSFPVGFLPKSWDMMSEALKNDKKKEKNCTVKKNSNFFSELWALGMLPKWFYSMNQQKFVTFCFIL